MRGLALKPAIILLMLVATACAEAGTDNRAGEPPEQKATDAPPSEPPAEEISPEDYDPALFENAASADNSWYPLRPGTSLSYRGSSEDDGEPVYHTVESIVTDLTKVIDGVPNVVVWERDYTEGELVESELALFATDRYGNVWHTGEYPEEYEDGELDKAPAWVHGLKGATAGITIMGEPRVGTPDYAQGYAPPPINWVDRGQVHRTGAKTCVPAGCYRDVVVIAEFEPGLPNAFQDKFYAPGVGVVRIGWRGALDEDKEVLELVRATELSPTQLLDARGAALALERRAFRVSKDVWARTAPAEPPAG